MSQHNWILWSFLFAGCMTGNFYASLSQQELIIFMWRRTWLINSNSDLLPERPQAAQEQEVSSIFSLHNLPCLCPVTAGIPSTSPVPAPTWNRPASITQSCRRELGTAFLLMATAWHGIIPKAPCSRWSETHPLPLLANRSRLPLFADRL